MELRRYVKIIRRRLLLIVLIVAAAVAAGWYVTPRTKTYTASALLYIGTRSINLNPASGQISNDRALGLDRLISTFTTMLRSEPVADAGIASAKVPRSAGTVLANTNAVQVPNTNLVDVAVTDQSPPVAQALANSLSDAFVHQIEKYEPASTGQPDQIASVYQRAGLPTTPNSLGLSHNLLLAGVLGLVTAGALVALLEYLDISLRSSEDVERLLELPVLGVIPAMGDELPAMERVGHPVSRAPVG